MVLLTWPVTERRGRGGSGGGQGKGEGRIDGCTLTPNHATPHHPATYCSVHVVRLSWSATSGSFIPHSVAHSAKMAMIQNLHHNQCTPSSRSPLSLPNSLSHHYPAHLSSPSTQAQRRRSRGTCSSPLQERDNGKRACEGEGVRGRKRVYSTVSGSGNLLG